MNFPNSVVRHVFATVALIFRCMAYVPESFPNHCDDRRLTEGQLLRRASVKRKPYGSPTKNGCANLTPLRCNDDPHRRHGPINRTSLVFTEILRLAQNDKKGISITPGSTFYPAHSPATLLSIRSSQLWRKRLVGQSIVARLRHVIENGHRQRLRGLLHEMSHPMRFQSRACRLVSWQG